MVMESIKLVVVDSDARLIKLISQNIKKNFHDSIEIVGTADNGITGFEKINKLQPEACIIDVALPCKEGLNVLSDIKNKEKTQDIICIMISAFVKDCILTSAMNLGCDYFYAKPFDITNILEKIISLHHERNSKEPTNNDSTISKVIDNEFSDSNDSLHKNQNSRKSMRAQKEQDERITKLLFEMGIYNMNNGFSYLKHSIII